MKAMLRYALLFACLAVGPTQAATFSITLAPEHASELFKAYARFADIDGRAKVATLEEIEGNDFNLNIPLYVAPADTGEKLTLVDALTNLEAAHAKAQETRAALEAELAKWGLGA